MDSEPATYWAELVGKVVILNSFGIVRIQGVAGDRLLLGEAGATTAIPLAVVRSVQALDGAPRVELAHVATAPA